jgi:phosphatidylserine/phosphatidylglycerophosphate/cardiolipin synthase-like enzyme
MPHQKIKESNPKIKIYALKQVPSKGWLADKRRAALIEFFFQYQLKAEQRYSRLVHDKFIIVDNDKINICTSNYTPTQFAWDDERVMKFKDEEGKKFEKIDTFSEVNAFVILEKAPAIVKQYENHFWKLWKTGTEIRIDL